MNEQTQPSPIDSLRSGLADLGHDVSVEPTASKSVSTNESTRGTTNTEGKQPSNNAEASTNNDAEAQTNNESETGASVSDSSINGESTDGQPSQPQAKKKNGNPRFQELANDNRALKEKLAALEAKMAQGQQQPAKATEAVKPVEHVPKPTPPSYDRKELNSIVNQLSAKVYQGQANEQEIGIYNAAAEQLKLWDKYDVQSELWELKNGQAAKEKDGYKAYYQQEAVKKYPALSDPNSEHSKLYASTRNRLNEIAKNLDVEGDYWAAMVSDLVLSKKRHDSETGALKEKYEKLLKDHNSLKEKLQPVESSDEDATVSNTGKPSNETPAQEFRRKMAQARRSSKVAA